MMVFQCARCGKEVETSRGFEHRGNFYCEECYMDILSPPKACDPWAIYSAKSFLKGKENFSGLTPQQVKIVNYIREKKEVTAEEMKEDLNITERELKWEFAVLRHMEVLAATKREGKILYRLFKKGQV
jgi:DNA-directed RNA polymerase subunit RPC12/RpoP